MTKFKSGHVSCDSFEVGISCETGLAADPPLTISRLVEMSAGSWLNETMDEVQTSEEEANIWLFLDEPDRPLPRVLAALAAARRLSDQGKRVTILDGDDLQAHFSGWAGRRQTEGWIDIVRYGTSLPVSSIVLPFGEGRVRFASVGSYRPTRLTPYEAGELISKLTIHADYVLIVTSIGDSAALWASLDGVAFVCREKDRLDTSETKALFNDISALKIRTKAVLIFEPTRRSDQEKQAIAENVRGRRKTGSSAIFRVAAIVLVLAIAGLGGWWFGLFSGGPAEGDVEVALDESTAEVVAERQVEPADMDEEPGNRPAADTTDAERRPGDETLETAAVVIEPQAADDQRIRTRDPEPVTTGGATAETPPAEPINIWQAPVGAAGYCLHVFSCANNAEADRQVAVMSEAGFSSEVHAAQIKGATWYRIYTGSFESVAACRAALPEAYEKLKTDWAAPVAYQSIGR